MLIGDEVTSETLRKELAATESVLARNEQKAEQSLDEQPLERLQNLQDTVESLSLAHDVATSVSDMKDGSIELIVDARKCVALAEILCRHQDLLQASPSQSKGARKLLDTLWKKEYQPLHTYVTETLIHTLRSSLRETGYPSKEACSRLLEQADESLETTSVISCCHWLTQLQIAHAQLQAVMTASSIEEKPWNAIVELCRPIVDRVIFHFTKESQERITSTRINRLPEWLFGYLKDHVFEDGPWDFIRSSSPLWMEDAPALFLNEMLSLAKFVLCERGFFQDECIVGPNSNPTLLSSSIEQLLRFDSYIRTLLDIANPPIQGLTQAFVVDELLSWWMERERETALSTMFHLDLTETPPNRISPRSELFCALIHSIRSKAALFESPGPYLAQVAVPLCTQYLDAIHESATDLRNLLSQRKLPSDADLAKNMQQWIELINGTHIAAAALLQGDKKEYGLVLSLGAGLGGGDHDLARVGRSMERLRDVLVEECSTTLVETVLMERTKLASYLMKCSHTLASTDWGDALPGLSPDLQETFHVWSQILSICKGSVNEKSQRVNSEDYAPVVISSNAVERLTDQFLEVALDAHGMTPDIFLPGAEMFASDVKTLFGDVVARPAVLRLNDILTFMTMEVKPLHALRLALFELSRPPTYGDEMPVLNFAHFSSDGTLLNEALSMLRAKGFAWILLEDAISILNRRKDSFL